MVKESFPVEVSEYLKEEFHSLYDYLSNGEGIEIFSLDTHQAMIILENKDELTNILNMTFAIEYIEELRLETIAIQRIGIYSAEDVQLYYYILSNELG